MSGTSGIRRSAAIAYLIAATVLVFRAGNPSESMWWLVGLGFVLWIASPVIFGLWAARWIKGGAHIGYIVAVALVAVVGFGIQWYALFIGPSDAQNALALVFGPLYQWIAICGVFAIAWLLARYVLKP